MNNNVLNNFIAKVTCFPLSVKQVILLHLYKDLQKTLSDDFIIGSDTNSLVYLYEPELSFVGKTELEERVKGFDAPVYNFLECLDKRMSIMEITLNNFWTLKETCKYFELFVISRSLKIASSKSPSMFDNAHQICYNYFESP